jgi:hypothetical protein
MARNVAPDLRDASVSSDGDTASIVADTGPVGMDCWEGLGLIVDDVVNISRAMEKQASRSVGPADHNAANPNFAPVSS